MNNTVRLDVHAHLVPFDAAQLDTMEGITYDAGLPSMCIDGNCVNAPDLFQPEQLIEWMDVNNVSKAWVSIPPPLYRQNLDEDATLQWCKYLNSGLLEITQSSGARLSPLFHLPTQHPKVAATIVEALHRRGYSRFAMPSGTTDDRCLYEAEFEPLWSALDQAGSFVFLHPGQCCDGRLRDFYLANLLGNPYETLVAISHVIFGGILDRYTRVTLCFAHCGGLTPMAAGRFQRGFNCERPGIDPNITPPESALKRLYVDCITHDETALLLAEKTFGTDHIVFGSDWPFPMGIAGQACDIMNYDEQRRNRLFDKNPTRLLNHLDTIRRIHNDENDA